MHRRRAAALLLLMAAAMATAPATGQPAHIDLQAAYRLEDPSGDVQVSKDDVVGQLPLGGPDFAEVDIVRVYVYEDTGPAGDQPGTLEVLVELAAEADPTANYTVSFRVEKGPRSLPGSTATGAMHNLSALVSGTRARATVPTAQVGATGGDLLTGLRVTATRTDQGDVPLAQDDQTGRDEAPDAGTDAPPYTFIRAPQPPLLDAQVASIDGTPGASVTVADDGPVPVLLRLRNLGVDEVSYSLVVRSEPPLQDPPVFAQALRTLAPGAQEEIPVQLSMAGMAGAVRVTFAIVVDGSDSARAVATVHVQVPAATPREVKPAGLDFLSPAAEAARLDRAFGPYGEAALLALLVLAAILAVYLLTALAPSTLAGGAAAEAPPLPREVDAAAPPAAFAAPPRAAKGEAVASTPPLPTAPLAAAAAATPAPAPLRIDGITHAPPEPEAGETVETEVVLRNDGGSRNVRVVLAVDGTDADEAAVTVPSRATKTVRLRWTAGAGQNRVKVRVLPT